MSWTCPPKYNFPIVNHNDLFFNTLKGELNDKDAKISLAKFLRYNIGFTTELITGGDVKLTTYQEILCRAVLNRNFSMFVLGRGLSKSWLCGQLSWMIPLFEPNTNIIICAPTFRAARGIFSYLEKSVNSRNSVLLRQIFGTVSKRPDMFEWPVIGETCVSSIKALPLNNERMRGQRANVLILDEFLLLSEDIIKNILMPFLVAPTDIKDRIVVREIEDNLIREGKIKEEDRLTFPNRSRMIACSSASFTFENLYKVYSEWMTNIVDDTKPVGDATYFVGRMGYKAVPEYMVDPTIIEEAKAGGEENPAFLREYCARFIDGSDSYFSAKRMHEQTIKDGDKPTTKLVGDKDRKYILSIDPSWSSSPSSDHFAMSVLEINEDDNSLILVHNYAVAGGQLNDHIRYFLYLLLSFNIVMIVADNADGNFIQAANESEIFTTRNIKLGFLDYEGDIEGEDYTKMLKEVRKQYNQNERRICFKHVFNAGSIRRINEQLQTFINTKKIFFASRLERHAGEYDKAVALKLPYEFSAEEQMIDFIANQDDLIPLVKKECALIEVRSSPTGGQVFDLPAALKRNTSATRARKDSYTSLMLGVEGFRAYIDIMRQEDAPKQKTFVPQMLGQSTYR